jgi:hypothetical protein
MSQNPPPRDAATASRRLTSSTVRATDFNKVGAEMQETAAAAADRMATRGTEEEVEQLKAAEVVDINAPRRRLSMRVPPEPSEIKKWVGGLLGTRFAFLWIPTTPHPRYPHLQVL